MKKIAVTVIALTLITVTGCTRNSDNQPGYPEGPRVTTIAPTNTSEPGPAEPTKTKEQTPDPEPTTTKPEEPKPSVSSDAGTPATQFAKRWGERYPNVPEFAILKAANGVCTFIENYGNGWESNELAQAGIRESAKIAGIEGNDALEFAQDANQNYCASRSNPT